MTGRSERPTENIDFDLIATSYRSLTDPAAFDEMIGAWNRKLAVIQQEPSWTEGHLDRHLFGHLSRLMELAEVATPGAEDPIREAVEQSEVATMVQSPDGRIVATNDAAATMFGVTAGAIDMLEWLHPSSQGDLALLRKSAVANGNRRRAILRYAGKDEERGFGHAMQLVEARVLDVPGVDTGFVTIRSLALPWSQPVGEALAEAFLLTDAELDVLRLFYLSRNLPQVAAARSVSLKTVRTQFKTILTKTESRSQANLLHIVAIVCARVAADGSGTEMGWSDPFGTEKIIFRVNGKRMAYSTLGPPEGRPMLWVHGPAFNGIPPQIVIDRLIAADIRMILPCRPGYGNSDCDPQLPVEEDQASALAELARVLNLENCIAVGTTCSAQALHLARDKVPDCIGTIVAISFCWKATAQEIERLPILHRTMYRLAPRAPAILRSICSVGIRIIRRAGPDWYVQRAHAVSKINRECLRNPETQALLRSDCRMMLAQGTNAFMADLLLAYADTEFAVRRAKAATLWLMGSQEQHFDRQHAESLSEQLKSVKLKVIPDCSELMLYQRPDLVADALIEALSL